MPVWPSELRAREMRPLTRCALLLAAVAGPLTAGIPAADAAIGPQTTVTINPVFRDIYLTDSAGFTVSYSGGSDGAITVIQYGDGSIAQATASGFAANFDHVYSNPGVYEVTAQVFANGCLAPCSATAVLMAEFAPCAIYITVLNRCAPTPPTLPWVGVPDGIPDMSTSPRPAAALSVAASLPAVKVTPSRDAIRFF
jgi:hypothetical protein